MSKELVIGSNRHETKVAILEEDQLVEVYFQRGKEYSLAGSIHKGRVTRVLPGMQSAFVDLGLERDTFLYVSDFFEENEDIDTVGDEGPVRAEKREAGERRDDRREGRRGGERSFNHERGSSPERAGVVERPLEEGIFDSSVELPKVRAIDAGAIEHQDFPEIEEEPGGAAGAAADAGEAGRNEGGENRSGDRGSRRGRRRRPRGRGFPETKYALPSGGPAGLPGATPSTERTPSVERGDMDRPSGERSSLDRLPGERLSGERFGGERSANERPSFERAYADRSTLPRINNDRPPFERGNRRPEPAPEQTDAADVIILPGESLAKYRRPAAEPAPQAAVQSQGGMASEAEKPERPPITPFFEQVAPESIQTPICEQPPEPVDSSVLEEAPAEETHAAPFEHEISSAEIMAEQQAIEHEAEELALADRVFAHHDTEDLGEDEKLREVESERVEAEAPGEVEPEEFELPYDATASVEITSPVVINTEPLTTFEATAPLGLEGEEEPEEGEAESGEAQVTGGSQTANLRDQSGRSRFSRRSRRRRGGNRMGGMGEGSAVPALAPSTGTGAAPALEPAESTRRETFEARSTERVERAMPSISDLLKAGQEIIVQIAKEPLGQKGARITSHIALPGRYVVFMPSVGHLGVSRKIASDEERQRLKQVLQRHKAGTTGGFIVRTAGEGVPEDEIAADMNFLYNLWLDIRQKAEKKPAPMLLHYDLDIVQRILRDHVTEEYKAIWVDNEEMYESVLTFMQRFQPSLVNRVKMYTRSAPIFDAFNITQELEKALRPKVWLKSGGYIVINQTEALVAIDINTGKYVGKSNRLEDTIVKTNTEAVKEIVRQIRLRDLGGIIVVDFIDMDERKNRQKVMAALEEAMETDKAPYKILQFNDFGLVAITRKRVKQSLERTLCSPCPYCEGAGYVKSVQTTIGEILVEAQKIARAMEGNKDVVLRVHPEVAKVLKASNNRYLEEVEEILGRPVLVAGDPALHTEKFDLA